MKTKQQKFTKTLLCNALFAASAISTGVASAAGFAIREESAYAQGSSFAGAAAGGAISTAFWNPANTSEVKGTEIEVMASLIEAKTEVDATGSSDIIYGALNETGDVGGTSIVPALFYAKEYDEKFAWGVSLTAPFGSKTEADKGSRSQYISLGSEAKAISFNPTLSYKVSDNTTLGAGIVVQNFDVTLERAIPVGASVGAFSAADPTLEIEGDGVGFGYTFGLTHKIGNSAVGLGYRSSMEHELEGSFSVPALGVNVPSKVDLKTPSSFSLGIKHQVNDKLNVGVTYEKTNWSSVGTLPVISTQTGGVVTLSGTPIAIPLEYVDTDFYSIGGEYQYSKDTVLRAGIGLDETTTRDTTRTTQLPDEDRIWLSVGMSKNLKSGMRLDLAYSYVWLKDTAEINIGPGHVAFTGLPYTGEGDPKVHILSLALIKQL